MNREERFGRPGSAGACAGPRWPAFIAVTLIDGLILHLLPPIGTGVDLIPAILLATFGNLILIGGLRRGSPGVHGRGGRRLSPERRPRHSSRC